MPRVKREVPIERYTVMTFAQVAEKLGVSAMRVCQIEKQAMEKIRKEWKRRVNEGEFHERHTY
jgi:DNA-directed RNA polymerase sigma subunit (sigma70/sigma32)